MKICWHFLVFIAVLAKKREGCTNCEDGAISCCDELQCEEETCEWTEYYGSGRCICNQSQCDAYDPHGAAECDWTAGECTCGCEICNAGDVSCCTEQEQCTDFNDDCQWHAVWDEEEVPLPVVGGPCICSDDQCAYSLQQAEGEVCKLDDVTRECLCNCVDCTAGSSSCCIEEECGDPCGWDGEAQACFCTSEQCQALAAEGHECEFVAATKTCSCLAATQPPDQYGSAFDGQLFLHDLSFDSISDVQAFSHDFVVVAALSTGSQEWQFVAHSVHKLSDILDLDRDWAVEMFTVEDDKDGASAHRIVESLRLQVDDPSSAFYQEFVQEKGASGATLTTSHVPEEDTTWKIISIVFITLTAVIVLAVCIFLLYKYVDWTKCCGERKAKKDARVERRSKRRNRGQKEAEVDSQPSLEDIYVS